MFRISDSPRLLYLWGLCFLEFRAPSCPRAPNQPETICLILWMYDSMGEEWGERFICARVIAVASRAAAPAAAQMVALCDPVVGFIEPSSGDPAASQLIEAGGNRPFVRNEDCDLVVGLRPTATPGAPPLKARFPLPPGF